MEPDSSSQVPYVPPGPRRRAQDLLDRLAVFRRDPRVAVVALLVVALVAGAAWYRMGTGSPPLASGPPAAAASTDLTTTSTSTSAASRPAGSTSTTTAAPKAGDAGARPVVHVAGAVNKAGIVDLAPGARAADAIAAAGGPRPDADVDRLNLAAKVLDGQRIFVPRVGEAITPAVGDMTTAPGGTTASGPVNLNTATQTELETLPGVGPAIATSILDLRKRKGGFKTVNELRDVKGIGESRFADLRDRVTV